MNTTASQASIVIQFVRAVLREAVNFKTWVVLLYSVVCMAVLGLGLVYPKSFSSSATILADRQNIIGPLLAGQAQTTTISDHARFVREVVTSPRMLKQAVTELGLVEDASDERAIETVVRALMSSVTVANVGPSLIKIQYSNSDPAYVYNIVSKITDLFIKDSSETKRKESREAFLFIDRQVKSYKAQLVEAEEKLKQFNSSVDGTEGAARQRITQVRSDVETLNLDIEEAKIRIRSLEGELENESAVVRNRYRADEFRVRLADAQSRLDTLKLTYTDDYPDVVALKQQIKDLKAVISTNTSLPQASRSSGDSVENPLYEELRTRLATEKVELSTKLRRLERTEKQLEREYERLEKIAAQQAELSELTRDYDVTRAIYEDMLSRKERARLSMTLDVEGQGVNYRIQEPAIFPLTPKGFRFLHFFLLGPVLGVLVPLGLLIVYVQLDPRIRFRESLEAITDVPILGVVPHMPSPLSKRVLRGDVILLGSFLLVVMCIYIAIAFAYRAGAI